MSNQTPEDNGEGQKLTLKDPVPPQILEQLSTLRNAKLQIAERMLELEQEKIHCLGAAKRLKDENQRIFTALLVERGLAPGTFVDLDPKTGLLSMQEEQAPAVKLEPEPSAEPPAEPSAEPPAESAPAR